jgi:hypothetical protein
MFDAVRSTVHCTLQPLHAQVVKVHQSTCPSYCIHADSNIIVSYSRQRCQRDYKDSH